MLVSVHTVIFMPLRRLLSGTTCLSRCLLRIDLLSVLVVSYAWGWLSVAAAFSRSDTVLPSVPVLDLIQFTMVINIPHNLAVDSARDAILQLQVHLRDGVFGVYGGFRDIT